MLHAVREVGNFAAHPIKSERTGEIIEVELGEAELNLEVLSRLFDFYYVTPKRIKARVESINEKLAEANKKSIKLSE